MKTGTRHSIHVIFLVISFSLLSTTCTLSSETTETPQSPFSPPSNPFGDGGFLSESPCAYPCFYGITPGETTEKEAIAILNDRDTPFKDCKSFNNSSEGGDRGITCQYCGFTFEKGFVVSVGFRPNEKIEVSQIIEKIGEPDRLIPFSISLPEYPMEGQYILCFDQPRISIWLPIIKGSIYNISSLSIVESINYGTDEAYRGGGCSMISVSIEWEGYGDYPIQRN